MKIIGFNYAKITVERLKPIAKANINTNIQITDIKKKSQSSLKTQTSQP